MSTRSAPHSRRTFVAVALLTSALLAVVVAAVIGTVSALSAAGAYAVLAGGLATATMQSLVVRVRRLWAYDRAALAASYRDESVTRSAEQTAFAETMSARITESRARVVRLQADLEHAESRRDELGNALADEQERSGTLADEVEGLQRSLAKAQDDLAHLHDELAADEAASSRRPA